MAALLDNRSYFECGIVEHIKKKWPRLRNEGGNARGRAFVIGTKDVIQDPTIVRGIFHVNSLYASILFDSGAERSFITPKFRKLFSHKSRKLDEP